MRKYILLLIMLNCSLISLSQELSLRDLTKMQQMELGSVNEFLISKSWTLIDSHHNENITDEYFVADKWTISKGRWNYIYNNSALGKIDYEFYYKFYDPDNMMSEEIRIITYTTANINVYLGIKNSLDSSGFKKFKEDFRGKKIQTSYMNETHVLRITNVTTSDNQTIYYVHLLNKQMHSKN